MKKYLMLRDSLYFFTAKEKRNDSTYTLKYSKLMTDCTQDTLVKVHCNGNGYSISFGKEEIYLDYSQAEDLQIVLNQINKIKTKTLKVDKS